jgi:uncharacterized protein (DUF2164 family)
MNDKIITLNKSVDKPLREDENPHDFNGSHFIVLKFSGDNDDFRGIPFIAMVEDEALALNDSLTRMLNHLEIFPGQIMAEQGAMDEDEIQNMQEGVQGSILTTQAGALRDGRIQKHPPLPMGGEYFNVMNTLQSLMDLVLGVPEFQRPKGSTRKTATEATFEQSDASIRREYFLGFTKKFIVSAVEKVAGLIQQYYDREREIRIEGETGFEFVEFTKDDITGEYDFDFDIQDMRFVSQAKTQQMINLVNVFGAHATVIPQFKNFLNSLDAVKFGREIFKGMDVNIDNFLKKPGLRHIEMDPAFENDLAMKGRRVPDPNPTEDHAAHLAMHAFVAQETQNDELIRHMQMHEFFKGIEEGTIDINQIVQLQQAAIQPQQPGQPGQAPQAPQGSAPAPAAPQAPTEPELAGGFFNNLSS